MPARDAERFLAALFGDAPADLFTLIWSLPEKRSHWFRVDQLDGAVALVDTARAVSDLYVGVALSPSDFGPNRRCATESTAGITALWADIDYLDEVHRKGNLPPSEDDARALVAEIGVEPSILVHSGHGLQGWWLLDEPLLFETPADRVAAAELTGRWNATLRARAAAHGWTVDATQDLARVLRVPGSLNHKSNPPVEAIIDTFDDRRRYAPDDFTPYLVSEAEWTALTRSTYVVTGLKLDPKAQPDVSKIIAWAMNDAKFRQTWERKRRDLKDDSPSAYDLSLATQAAGIGWSDQEIADLLVAHRREHGDDLKLRDDYYARTIAMARDTRTRQVSIEDIGELTDRAKQAQVANGQGAPTSTPGADHTRHDLVEEVAKLLNVRCTRWVKYKQDPARYRMETTTGSITIGTATALLSQSQMRAAIASATGIVIPVFKTGPWHAIIEAILACCEDEDTGMESTDEGLAYAWLSEYLQDRTVLTERVDAIEQQWPFVENGTLYIFGPRLRAWLWMSRAERVTPQRMGEVLRSFRAVPETIAVSLNGARSSRSVWRFADPEGLGVAPVGQHGVVNPEDEPFEKLEVPPP